MSTASQYIENANAALMFALPLTDPFTNPPHRPIPTGGATNPAWQRHLTAVDDAAREIEAPDDDAEVVYFARRKPWSGGDAA